MNSNPDFPIDLDPARLPAHVAIIMDGNGRWAKRRLFNRVKGHEKGSEAVRAIVEASREIGIRYLTLYAFSTENWDRPKTEVAALMSLLKRFVEKEAQTLIQNNIRLTTIGETDRLFDETRKSLLHVIEKTAHLDGMVLNLALSYGGRAELTRMAKQVARAAKQGSLDPDEITENMVADFLFTRNMPDVDLLIRTSGEMRISNFLLWQIAYAEIFVTPTLWPDFGKQEYMEILQAFQQRERRFGKVARES